MINLFKAWENFPGNLLFKFFFFWITCESPIAISVGKKKFFKNKNTKVQCVISSKRHVRATRRQTQHFCSRFLSAVINIKKIKLRSRLRPRFLDLYYNKKENRIWTRSIERADGQRLRFKINRLKNFFPTQSTLLMSLKRR